MRRFERRRIHRVPSPTSTATGSLSRDNVRTDMRADARDLGALGPSHPRPLFLIENAKLRFHGSPPRPLGSKQLSAWLLGLSATAQRIRALTLRCASWIETISMMSRGYDSAPKKSGHQDAS